MQAGDCFMRLAIDFVLLTQHPIHHERYRSSPQKTPFCSPQWVVPIFGMGKLHYLFHTSCLSFDSLSINGAASAGELCVSMK